MQSTFATLGHPPFEARTPHTSGWSEAARDDLVAALRRRPSALFTDIDGTLSPLVPSPRDAMVLPELREQLERVRRHVDLLCVLTGRAADDAWRLVRIDDALYVGNHGAETWRNGELMRPPGMERYQPRLARAEAMLRCELADVPGLEFEPKGIGFAIHFRDPATAEGVLDAAWRISRSRSLTVLLRTGHVEVRAPVDGDKGTALARLASAYQLRGIVVVGDDPVDLPAFRAAVDYAGAADGTAFSVAVGPHVAAAADLAVADPAGLATLLDTVVSALES